MKRSLLLLSALLLSAASFAAPSAAQSSPWPEGALVVDVRTPEEYAAGRIPGAALFPYDQLRARSNDFAALVGEKGKARPLVVYCRSGRRSAIAAAELKKLGYRDVTDFGAIGNWRKPLER